AREHAAAGRHARELAIEPRQAERGKGRKPIEENHVERGKAFGRNAYFSQSGGRALTAAGCRDAQREATAPAFLAARRSSSAASSAGEAALVSSMRDPSSASTVGVALMPR